MLATCLVDIVLDEDGNVVDLTKAPDQGKGTSAQKISIASDDEADLNEGADDDDDGLLGDDLQADDAGMSEVEDPEVVDEGEASPASVAAARAATASATQKNNSRAAFQRALAKKHSTMVIDSVEEGGTTTPQARKRGKGD